MRSSQERQLEALEAEYMALLTTALKRCADGRWGLFDQNDPVLERLGKRPQERLSSPEAAELLKLGSQVERPRNKLGYTEAFPLHERLLRMRSSSNANLPGEPKLARAWLQEF